MKSDNAVIYQIQFNTDSKSESDRWRLISENGENLVSSIVIDANTYTTKDYVDDAGHKNHITCMGKLHIKNGVAHISIIREDIAFFRHILKTITYRILGTTTTFTAAYIMTNNINVSGAIGIGELILKPALYFIHERIWYKIDLFRK